MQEKKLYELKIDDDFKNLIPKLTNEEIETLETMLLKEGCREPICIWNGYIIDGHNRYFLCHKNNIPFNYQEVPDLKNKDEVLDWMCSNQLGRRNISDETRMYLIGKRFNLEKKNSNGNNINGNNQYNSTNKSHKEKTCKKFAKKYNVSSNSIYRYAKYAKQIDDISQKESQLANKILNGKVKFTRDDIKNLSQQTEEKLEDINKKLNKHKANIPASVSNKIIYNIKHSTPEPDYDPDSDVISLALTIPYWTDSVERIINKKDINKVSKSTRWKLITEIANLDNKIKEITLLMENNDE